ncbi:MAG: hypothetical protein M1817_002824 [Caeruleum heppii]|nr:MAG: hypothetical protein M1817_002824 [Caeruleum heppii]
MATEEDVPSTTLPKKRPLEEDHAPSVPSPLNPDTPSTTTKAKPSNSKAPIHREPREKKETLKKREAKGTTPSAPTDNARATPEKLTNSHGPSKQAKATQPTAMAPLRYKLAPPRPSDFDLPRGPVLTPHHCKLRLGCQIQFYETSEHVYNRKGFRYTHCVADPLFPSSLYYRQTETEPFHPRINYEDSSSHILFDSLGTQITTDKGFRMARANVSVREGRWYWECKITSGIPSSSQTPSEETDVPNGDNPKEPRGHVRVGFARREATLDAPVGFDAYSYGLRDVSGQKVHMSRPVDFLPPGPDADIREGDVIGLEIQLPSLHLHRKIVRGDYNPAVDVSDEAAALGVDPHSASSSTDIIRDRIPVPYRNHLYFEQFEYHSTKELEELMNPSPTVATATATNSSTTNSSSTTKPHPTHPSPALRTLPNSHIKIYKNGLPIGLAFENLLAFLPPASKPLSQGGSSSSSNAGIVGAREGLDDGMLGYFPALSVFRGGAVQANFGPGWWCPPQQPDDPMGDTAPPPAEGLPPMRPLSDRYHEQIAEDVTYDIVDEVDFWVQDRAVAGNVGVAEGTTKTAAVAPAVAPAVGAVVAPAKDPVKAPVVPPIELEVEVELPLKPETAAVGTGLGGTGPDGDVVMGGMEGSL